MFVAKKAVSAKTLTSPSNMARITNCFSVAGKSSTMFIKENLAEAKRRVTYQKYKELCADLTKAQVELVPINGFGD